jgi:hypothetical protein
MRISKSVLMALAGLLLWSGITSAQCPTPDQLDGGPCCALATPKIPAFPKFNQSALEICWLDCNVNATVPYTATWKFTNAVVGNPSGTTQSPCGERMAQLELATGGGVSWAGNLRMQYSRTWMETDPSGFPVQVWRFLVNGDLRALNPALIPCPVPACAPAHGNSVRVSGYIDHARNCALLPVTYQRAWMLTHACDAIDHAPGFPRAGAFHPNRSYSWVGPAAGFVAAPLQPLEGTPGSLLEALRRRRVPPAPALPIATCTFEERVNFTLAPGGTFCMCGLPPTQQFQIANLNLNSGCGSVLTTPGGPFLPGFLSMGIGSWTIPAVFPGVEAVRWNASQYNDFDPCTGVLQPEVCYGVTTIGGYPAMQLLSGPMLPAILPPTFIDQSNARPSPAGGVVMNVPYVSDLFLNLNH